MADSDQVRLLQWTIWGESDALLLENFGLLLLIAIGGFVAAEQFVAFGDWELFDFDGIPKFCGDVQVVTVLSRNHVGAS